MAQDVRFVGLGCPGSGDSASERSMIRPLPRELCLSIGLVGQLALADRTGEKSREHGVLEYEAIPGSLGPRAQQPRNEKLLN